jgi:hypothetical protein
MGRSGRNDKPSVNWKHNLDSFISKQERNWNKVWNLIIKIFILKGLLGQKKCFS